MAVISISAGDYNSLVQLIQAANIDMRSTALGGSGPFVFEVDQLTMPDSVAAAVEALMVPSDWRTTALHKTLQAYAANARYNTEIAGITATVSTGVSVDVATDEQTQAKLTGAALMAQTNPGFTTQWKQTNNDFVTLDAAQIVALAELVAVHVAACFGVESSVDADIVSGSITTTAQIDAAFAAIST